MLLIASEKVNLETYFMDLQLAVGHQCSQRVKTRRNELVLRRNIQSTLPTWLLSKKWCSRGPACYIQSTRVKSGWGRCMEAPKTRQPTSRPYSVRSWAFCSFCSSCRSLVHVYPTSVTLCVLQINCFQRMPAIFLVPQGALLSGLERVKIQQWVHTISFSQP